MDKYLHPFYSAGMKLLINSQPLTVSPWRVGKGYAIYPTLYRACNYLSLLGLKLSHLNKSGHYRENILSLLWNKTLFFSIFLPFTMRCHIRLTAGIGSTPRLVLGLKPPELELDLGLIFRRLARVEEIVARLFHSRIISKLSIWKLSPSYVIFQTQSEWPPFFWQHHKMHFPWLKYMYFESTISIFGW